MESAFNLVVIPLVMDVFISSRVPLCFDLSTVKDNLKDIFLRGAVGRGNNWLKWWGEICPKSGGGQRITLFSVYFANKLPYARGEGGWQGSNSAIQRKKI